MPPDIRWQQRFANFCQALDLLETFFQPPEFSERERQGLIKAFEYGFELGCTTLRDLLLAEGNADLIGSRDTLRLAFRVGRIRELLLPWSIDLSLHHELPAPLREPVARVGRRLAP